MPEQIHALAKTGTKHQTDSAQESAYEQEYLDLKKIFK